MSLRVNGLAKSFDGVPALRGVDLHVAAGQVHALLGHNGAGKSTLIKCLGGAFAPDAGTIEVNGARFSRLTPHESISAGVAIIFQTLSVVEPLTVAENIFLGQEWTRWGLVQQREQQSVAAELLERVGASCSPRHRVGDLPMGQRQLVEIAKALSRSASVLILDEPTAALSGRESDALAARVDDLRSQGLAIVYITHLLSEVERLADAVTVLRDGRVTYHSPMSGHNGGSRTQGARQEVTRQRLVDAIAGPGGTPAREPRRTVPAAAPKLTVDALAGPGFGPVSLRVAPGEIVGLYGLIGSGRTRLLETLFGRRRRTAGSVRLNGRSSTPSRPAAALASGVALVPADRRRQGLFATLSAQDNALLPSLARLARGGVRARRAEQRLFTGVARSVGVNPLAPALPAAMFSGGNQQKLVLGRWVNQARRTEVLLLDDPTQGVDAGSRAELYRAVRAVAERDGVAVVFASSDPEEVVALADRCLVMARGRVIRELAGARLTESALLSVVHDAGEVR